MSKGTPRFTLRIPEDVMRRVEEQVLSRNAVSPLEPWDTSDFVRIAIVEKLEKMRRSREGRHKVKLAVQLHDQVEEIPAG